MFLTEYEPAGEGPMYRRIVLLSDMLWVVLMMQANVFYSANKCTSPIHVPDGWYP